MANWVAVGAVADCPSGSCREVVTEDRVLAPFNVDGAFFVLDGVCPHQGGPLGQGTLTGCVVTCPWHGWQFDVRTGQHQLSRAVTQPRFATRVEGDQIFVDLGE